jgi:Fe-S-cluster containining protein
LNSEKEKKVGAKAQGGPVETGEIIEGFVNSYFQLDASITKIYQTSVHLYALIDLLLDKGIIRRDEFEKHIKLVEKGLKDGYKEAGIGILLHELAYVDKYTLKAMVDIDCENRKHICRTACCSFTFSLSVQDIYEGVRWNLGNPFMSAKGANGYCVHWQPDVMKCSIYERRPLSCRKYDCRNDSRIWLDFDKMVINPELYGNINSAQTRKAALK